MALNNEIRFCLDRALSSIVGLPTIVNENLNNFPQDPANHIETKFVPTSRRATTVGKLPYTKKLGFYRAVVRVILNSGTGDALNYADLIESAFTPGSWFTTHSQTASLSLDFVNQVYSYDPAITTVVIDYAETSGSYEESPYHCTPVVIGWHCNTP